MEMGPKVGKTKGTGDASGNLDILYYYCPWLKNNFNVYTSVDPEGYMADTGDGHRMGMWIGAQMERGPHAPNVHNMGGPLGVAPYLQLDVNGERFSIEYPITVPGMSHSMALTYGRLAGMNAANSV